MKSKETWVKNIAMLTIPKDALRNELENILAISKREDSDSILNYAKNNGDYRNSIKSELDKMDEFNFKNYAKSIGLNFLVLEENYSVLADKDLTDTVNNFYDMKQDWQLSLCGYNDGDKLVTGNIYNSSGEYIGVVEVEMAGNNKLEFISPTEVKLIDNNDKYKEEILGISTEYLSNADTDDLIELIYEDFKDEIYRDLNIKSKEDYSSIMADGNSYSHKELENANNYSVGYISKYLSSLSSFELEKFAKANYDEDFNIKNSMTSSILADVKDVDGNILIYNDESYPDIDSALDGIKYYVEMLMKNQYMLSLVSSATSDNSILAKSYVNLNNERIYEDKDTGKEINIDKEVAIFAQIQDGEYVYNLDNIAAWGDGALMIDGNIDIQFENREIHISKSIDGVSVDIYCDEILVKELGWLSREDIEDIKVNEEKNNKVESVLNIVAEMSDDELNEMSVKFNEKFGENGNELKKDCGHPKLK